MLSNNKLFSFTSDFVSCASPGITDPARRRLQSRVRSLVCVREGDGERVLPRSPRCLLSTAPAAASSQFVTASVCVLLLTSIAQLMLKSILVLILGHD